MKTYKYITLLAFIGLFISSCTEDDKGQEYPGNIIIHGSTYLNVMDNSDNDLNARFYAFSGGSSTDLSALNGEDFTYELWFRVDSDALIGDRTAPSGATAFGACISERAHNFELYLVDDADADFAVKYGRINVNDDFHMGTMTSEDSSINLSFDEWVHVAISRSSTDGIAKFYINGTLIDSSDDPLWIQPVNDKWLDFNYMYRENLAINFFKGSMENIRVSTIDRYPTEFIPNKDIKYNESLGANGEIIDNGIDEYTLLQLNLDNHLTPFSPATDFNKIEIHGFYNYYIKLHNDYFKWQNEIIDEYPVTGY